MFNLQGSEIIIILLLALVVLGPEKLPDAMRKMGQMYAELRKMSTGFQQEFRAAVDEPMREIRETANTLRDSADFTKLQTGERDEKPKSAEMQAGVDPVADPVDEVPTFEPTPDDGSGGTAAAEPELSADSKPAPFTGNSSAAPREPVTTEPTEIPAPPAPFTGMSSAAPRPEDATEAAMADETPEQGSSSEAAQEPAGAGSSGDSANSDDDLEATSRPTT